MCKTVSHAKISQLLLGSSVCNVSLLWWNWKSDFLRNILDNSSPKLLSEFFCLALAGQALDQTRLQSVMPLCHVKVLAVNTKLGLRDLAKGGPNSPVFCLPTSSTSSFLASPEISLLVLYWIYRCSLSIDTFQGWLQKKPCAFYSKRSQLSLVHDGPVTGEWMEFCFVSLMVVALCLCLLILNTYLLRGDLVFPEVSWWKQVLWRHCPVHADDQSLKGNYRCQEISQPCLM